MYVKEENENMRTSTSANMPTPHSDYYNLDPPNYCNRLQSHDYVDKVFTAQYERFYRRWEGLNRTNNRLPREIINWRRC